MVDKRYDVYCRADRHFYDLPDNTASLEELEKLIFAMDSTELPTEWQKSSKEDWTVCTPPAPDLPLQGWKIHVSAHMQNADSILESVYNYCLPRGIAFKYLAGRHVLQSRNLKYADRGASGKFITIYPVDEQVLHTTLRELGAELKGQQGPYILSDLRWGDGPLYVRYGGFVERHCLSGSGALVGAIEDDQGVLVPDRRDPVFYVPPWVDLPEFLVPHLEARRNGTTEDIGYTIERAVHFSNAGGLYEAHDRKTGRKVILKEARPFAGITMDSADAVDRLRHEKRILERLRGIDAVPALLDYFEWGGHHFLVQEFIEGDTLSKTFALRYPLHDRETSPTQAAEHTEWALDISRQVEQAVALIHERGIVFGDLHPFNILVSEDGKVSLIDFEVSAEASEGLKPSLVNPAFAAPSDRVGFAHDDYALGCLRLSLFLPLTTLLTRDLNKAIDFAQEIRRMFPVPVGYLEEAIAKVTGVRPEESPALLASGAPATATLPRVESDPAVWAPLRDSIALAIVRSATPERDDRLFPGDIEQFHTGALNLMHGASGVLLALKEAGCAYPPEFDDWLTHRALRPRPQDRLGLYDGMHGVSYALLRLGHEDTARELIGLCLKENWERLGTDLKSGMSGIGLNLLAFGKETRDPEYTRTALRAAELVGERLGPVDSVPAVSGGGSPYAGLMRGSSGPALLFLRLYERTGDTSLLDLAHTALRQDLRRCVTRDNGMMQVNEGWRTVPYLATGSVGIGTVLDLYLRHREDEELALASDAIAEAAASQFFVQPDLFNGRAGVILYLAGKAGTRPTERTAEDLARQLQLLNWHSLSYRDGLAFPGEMLIRLSMDLATGSAGVLMALSAALNQGRPGPGLPFLTAAL
ncbi:class III lanthionine synthetase LanKC [Streptomyces olivoreticuli]|uniref:class III lanthionine synthetase LanKC n=1 Tax=Streptomyces olivoreticuli TaxID=68246 RepID=UPI002657D65A|nr:class III lanthionine synthetase LanKC [Streptomyces olivoreticuli]WKK26615.1 class III lanthionine synthetase LanKC [Streptomyces olivoreticuli]